MTTVFIKDDLRASVEAASGGLQTVLYTALGQPTFMNVIPQFLLEDIDAGMGSGVHPAFIVGGVAKSEIFVGTYQGIVKNGEMLSLPGVDPTTYVNFDQAVAFARASGVGHHCMTNAEFAAVALWCKKNGFTPKGNTNWGKSSDSAWETARRVDGLAPGLASGTGRTLTGSGPASWRHNNLPSGISDLNGNIWEWTPGLRLNVGEVNIIANNNAALLATDHSVSSADWRAIDGATGALVAPGSANTVKIAGSGTAAYTLVVGSGAAFEGMTNPGTTPVSVAALNVLKAHGVYPVSGAGTLGGDGFWHELTGETLPIRGGDWGHAAVSGVFALNLSHVRSNALGSLGFRPAFVA